ncbi:MAG: SDR family oxidoreductase [Chloroflexota bacterium]|nr:SDR family oxidoreductase [Chloroflexota bacterium]
MAVTTATEPHSASARGAAPTSALVTGASSGIGAAFADRFARDGHDLVVVARRRDRLEALADRLRSETGVEVSVLAADLTDPAGLRDVEHAIDGCGGLEFLVNCAGAAGYMPFVSLPPARAEELIRLHVVAPTRLTRAALPAMIARGRGVVINVSSALAFSGSAPAPPLPQRAVYAAAKSYLNTFTEILANELAGTGVEVQALCPGIVRTEFHTVAGYDVSHVAFALEPADVVAASLAGVRLGEVICMPSLDNAALLADAEASHGRLLDGARSGSVARRYRAP